ncbi:MAG TPA: dihydropteroate synthase [Gemmatimonadaceae bacterium]
MSDGARIWRAGDKSIALDRPVVIGILNVTPDSFSDGGQSFSFDSAVARALELLGDGADVLDIGGESTRPGAAPVEAAEEQRRVIPIIEAVRRRVPAAVISVDTVKAATAEAAVAAGADIVNDVSGHRLDPRMGGVCASAGCGVVLMHSRGSVADMASYELATYGPDVTGEVSAELRAAADNARGVGIAVEAIVLDPGIGFSKRSAHSVSVLRELPRIVDLGYPVMVGVSRKRVIGELAGVAAASERDAATAGANVYALTRGAMLFRVHDVRVARHALDTAWALLRSEPGDGASVRSSEA